MPAGILLSSLGYVANAKANTLSALNTQNFSQRSLSHVLFGFRQAGFPLVFSDALVASDLIVSYSPPAGEPLMRLQYLLEPFGLGLEQSSVNNDWLIIKKPADFTAKIFLHDTQTQEAILQAALSEDGRPSLALKDRPFFEVGVFKSSPRHITISHDRCLPLTLAINSLAAENTLAMTCTHAVAIEETLVLASFYRWQKKSTASHKEMDTGEIAKIPTRGNDPLQTIAALPGVANSGVSAKSNIRGGATDELLILFDGVELIEPFHLKDFQGLLSGINNHNVERLDMYTGGYPAQFGNKMSGVMAITPIKPKGELDNLVELNPLYSAATFTGFTDNKQPANYYVASLRRGHLETSLKALEENYGAPRFNDTFLQFHKEVNDKQQYDAGFLSIRDDIGLQLHNTKRNEQAQSIYNSQYAWLKATLEQSSDFVSHFQFSSSYSKTNRHGELALPSNNSDHIPSALGRLHDNREFNLYDLDYTGKWQWLDTQHLTFGANVQRAKAEYDYQAVATRGALAAILNNNQTIDWSIQRRITGYSAAGFLSWYSEPTDNFIAELGLRGDLQTYTVATQHQLSPRIALNYQLNNDLELKASAGRFFQAPAVTDLDVTAGQSNFYRPQKSDHYILGVEYHLNSDLSVGLEGYTKKIFSPKPRAENIFNPYVLLPELADDRIYLTPSAGTADGLEASIEYFPLDTLSTWLAFSVSEVEDKIDGKIERRGWNQVLAASTGAQYTASSWSLSARIHWRSGWPSTQLPTIVDSLTTPVDYSRNNSKLPEFLSFDLRVNKNWTMGNYLLEGYLDITNATDRHNYGYYDVNVQSAVDQQFPYVIDSTPRRSFPFFPMVGLVFHF